MQSSWLAPFQVRSFRFQWPAALITVWALEMEVLILGWYVLVETGSVVALTLFAASFYFGTLIAPMLGVVADRIGHCNTLVLMRTWYATLATALLVFVLGGNLTPMVVLGLAILNGLVRPSDLAIRSAFMAGILPRDLLMPAMALERTTIDSARVIGALVGAGLFAALGMAAAYVLIVALYVAGALLTVLAGRAAPPAAATAASDTQAVDAPVSFWRQFRDGIAFVRGQPVLRAAIWLAVLVNLTAYPLTNGLLPYAAREVYLVDERGLAFLVASFASGALVGSIVFSTRCRGRPLARMMLASTAVWYAMMFAFGHMTYLAAGMVFLFLAGIAQSLCMISMIVLILRATAPEFAGRVMGVRILAIYSLPLGLLAAGWLIGQVGFAATTSGYSLVGIAMVLAIALRFHADLWPVEAPANGT